METNNENVIWQELSSISRATETNMDSLKRKRTGSYYTDLELTDLMMEELVSHLVNGPKRIYEYRFLEPCVGSGNFVFSYLKSVNKIGVNSEEAVELLNNIYVSDINDNALDAYKKSLIKVADLYWGIILDEDYFSNHIRKGLLIDVTASELKYSRIDEVFPYINNKFDIVVTNPPYKNLKAERNQYANDEEYEIDKGKYNSISGIVKKSFTYSVSGVLNLYKLFVEEIIDKYSNSDAHISLLIPSSILSDKTCAKLRTHILKDMNLLSVKIIGEGSGYIDANQALCAMLIKKGSNTSSVNITKDLCKSPDKSVDVLVSDILNENTDNSIIAIDESEYERLKVLRKHKVVKELEFITNLRGELDLTANKKEIVSENTGYRLLRGKDINFYEISNDDTSDFASNEFVKATKKQKYINRDRIICQQIANMHKARRVTFAYIPSHIVLANSCNFISVSPNEFDIDIYTLLGLFNTRIIDWYFKLTSSNNHINNYEIDCFPVPINSSELKQISKLAQRYLTEKDDTILNEIECLAEKAYGLNCINQISESNIEINSKESIKDIVVQSVPNDDRVDTTEVPNVIYTKDYHQHLFEDLSQIINISKEESDKILESEVSVSKFCEGLNQFNSKVVKGIILKYRSLNKGKILNHTSFKLSDLDLEMIANIPQGGSWKDIPPETVAKSQRLVKITQSGGRTTLYGRIDYNKPSYTITTYFNRPGNGTYVHPVHERVISVREAARFQTFTDDYYFYGNKTQLLKQVGNAVPTLLAYQIANRIVRKVGCNKSIDLFCGAGGMTAGFKAAGIRSLLSNDIEESACITLKINNPEINVLCGDITQEETKSSIEQAAVNGGADIICGGPPCQGFSMAGFRAEDDPRNQLFREFVDIVKRVNPKVIVFENVEGLLSYQGGKTYHEVLTLFSELGFYTEGRKLITTEYAVPQKRKRVIIICTRKDLGIKPSELFPERITFEDKKMISARETIEDLEDVICSEDSVYDASISNKSNILKFFLKELTYSEYVSLYSDNNNDSENKGDNLVENIDFVQLAFDI